MDRKTVKREMQKYGSFLSVQQFADFLGVDRKTARNDYLKGLEYVTTGKHKKYFVGDLVDVLMERKRVD